MNIEQELIKFDAPVGAQMILSSVDTTKFEHRTTSADDADSLWTALKKETALLLCTRSAKYKKERDMLRTTAKPAVLVLSGFITQQFGIAAGTATCLAAAAILVPIRLAVTSWCSVHAPKIGLTEHERKALQDIAGTSGKP